MVRVGIMNDSKRDAYIELIKLLNVFNKKQTEKDANLQTGGLSSLKSVLWQMGCNVICKSIFRLHLFDRTKNIIFVLEGFKSIHTLRQ